jgi:aldehyde dehydrogenase (NAD+)
MRIMQEGFFGPVMLTVTFKTSQKATSITNDSNFGLVGGVYTVLQI